MVPRELAKHAADLANLLKGAAEKAAKDANRSLTNFDRDGAFGLSAQDEIGEGRQMKRALPRYTRVKGKRGRRSLYWEMPPRLCMPGLHSRLLGPYGPEALAMARDLNRQLNEARAQAKRQRHAPQMRLTLVPLGYQLLQQLNADLERRRKQTPSNFHSDFSSDIPRQPLYSASTAPVILAGADVKW
jgi:hypothetical protein